MVKKNKKKLSNKINKLFRSSTLALVDLRLHFQPFQCFLKMIYFFCDYTVSFL